MRVRAKSVNGDIVIFECVEVQNEVGNCLTFTSFNTSMSIGDIINVNLEDVIIDVENFANVIRFTNELLERGYADLEDYKIMSDDEAKVLFGYDESAEAESAGQALRGDYLK